MKCEPEDMAFPVADMAGPDMGLTKREYFAAVALQGYLSRALDLEPYDYYARCAVVQADALIAVLNEETAS